MRTTTIEDALIGAVLLNWRVYSQCAQIVEPEDFSSERLGKLWKLLAEMISEGAAVDVVTVSQRSDIDRMVLLEAQDACAISAHGLDYAHAVRLAADRRMVARKASILSHTALDDSDPITLAAETLAELRTRQRESASSAAELLPARYEQLSTPRDFIGFPSFPSVHLHAGDMFVIGARRGVGKSALAAQIADEWSREYPTRIYSLEMLKGDWADRLIARHAGVSVNELDEGLTHEQAEVVRLLTSDLLALELSIADHISTVDALIADIRRFATEGGKIAIVDYLGLLVSKGRGESRYEAVTEASRRLKSCALATGIVLVVLSQLSRQRDVSGRDRLPSLSDLRDSGAVEQDADGVLLLHRFTPDDMKAREGFKKHWDVSDLTGIGEADDLAQFDFAKMRRGASFAEPMRWSGPGQYFSRVPKW